MQARNNMELPFIQKRCLFVLNYPHAVAVWVRGCANDGQSVNKCMHVIDCISCMQGEPRYIGGTCACPCTCHTQVTVRMSAYELSVLSAGIR